MSLLYHSPLHSMYFMNIQRMRVFATNSARRALVTRMHSATINQKAWSGRSFSVLSSFSKRSRVDWLVRALFRIVTGEIVMNQPPKMAVAVRRSSWSPWLWKVARYTTLSDRSEMILWILTILLPLCWTVGWGGSSLCKYQSGVYICGLRAKHSEKAISHWNSKEPNHYKLSGVLSWCKSFMIIHINRSVKIRFNFSLWMGFHVSTP